MGGIEAGGQRCPHCWGSGKVFKQVPERCRKQHFPNQLCWDCKDTGTVLVEKPVTCDRCWGTGKAGY